MYFYDSKNTITKQRVNWIIYQLNIRSGMSLNIPRRLKRVINLNKPSKLILIDALLYFLTKHLRILFRLLKLQ